MSKKELELLNQAFLQISELINEKLYEPHCLPFVFVDGEKFDLLKFVENLYSIQDALKKTFKQIEESHESELWEYSEKI